jgi:hypothetical protein
MLVKRSIKAILNNSPWFLVIVIEIFTLFVKKNTSHEKIEKLLYTGDKSIVVSHRRSRLSTGLVLKVCDLVFLE